VKILWVLLLATPILASDTPQLPPLPDREGFAGSFAGVSHGALIVAGGANFPEKKPWEGGTKAWYDQAFVLEPNTSKWKPAGKLPRAMGYGVSVTYKEGLIAIGGADPDQHYAEVYRIEWIKGTLKFTELPKLPKPLAYACGAMLGETLYVGGGSEKPASVTTSHDVYRLDLSAANLKWEVIEGSPTQGRMLAVGAASTGRFWMVSGVDLSVGKDGTAVRKYLSDAHSYSPKDGWKRMHDLPRSTAAAPSPAPASGDGIFILGGDDGTQVGVAPDKQRGFPVTVLQYDVQGDRWIEFGILAKGQVTTPCVPWGNHWVVPSGEVRPGVRTPYVATFSPTK
jgi:N-acetylneuraminate epimerase